MHVGVDIGGTKLLCRAVSASGDVYRELRVDTGPGCGPGQLDAAIDEFVGSVPAVRTVGIACPGLISPDGARVVVADVLPQLEGWRPRALDGPRPGCLVNDVRAALLAATVAHPQDNELAVVVVGTGIAAGFTSRGHVHRGADGWAGELGSIPARVTGSTTTTTLDAVASGAAVLRHLEMPPAEVAARAADGQVDVVRVIEAAGQALGEGLAALVNLVNPRRVVLDGGTLAYPGYLEAALSSARRHALPQHWAACEVAADEDPGTLVVRGAVQAGLSAGLPALPPH